MRLLLFLLLPFSLLSQTKVNTQILQKHNYCGGAKPPPEILAQYDQPRPYANKKLVIVSSTGKTCRVSTNSNGYLKIRLKIGSYKVYEAWRYDKKSPDGTDIKNFDSECLKQVWEKVDITIDTKKKSQNIVIDIDEAFCPHALPCLLNPHFPE